VNFTFTLNFTRTRGGAVDWNTALQVGSREFDCVIENFHWHYPSCLPWSWVRLSLKQKYFLAH